MYVFFLPDTCLRAFQYISKDGETVEYTVVTGDNGKTKAENVTGPMGAYVQGAPRNPRMFNDDGGFGGGFGGGDRY